MKSININIYIVCTSFLFPKVLYHDDGSVKGIATVDVGIAKDGSPKVMSNKCNSGFPTKHAK